MPSKKFLVLSVAISLLAHALLISATGLIERGRGKPQRETAITVSLPETLKSRSGLMKQEREAKSLPPDSPPEEATESDEPEQETIALDSEDERFAPYLKIIKQKIENIWSYPPEALVEKVEGVSTVLFSLNSRGRLVGAKLIESSGHKALDRGTITVIKAAAPYAPFPPEINLSRLHIQAAFRYSLLE